MKLPILEDLGDVRGKKILVRADLNVPLREEEGAIVIADEFRIEATMPTLRWLTEHGADVTVCSHLGRPKSDADSKYSMAPVRAAIQRELPEVEVLENLRFHAGETANDPEFARSLADGYDAYVLDAFGACHRAHASIDLVPRLLRSVAGRNLELEVEALSKLLDDAVRPYIAIVGGAKISDKLALVRSLLGVVDEVLIGGAMAFTFFASQGHGVGDSLVEPAMVETCGELLASGKIRLPLDIVTLPSTASFGAEGGDESPEIVGIQLTEGVRGLDVGPATVRAYGELIQSAKTIFWNGPMGVYEDPRLSSGTLGVARAVAASSAYSVVGGGDSAAALRQEGLEDAVSHLSTGGGASLEFLETQGQLPGIVALLDGVK
jgi:phosphoglycerate kinase